MRFDDLVLDDDGAPRSRFADVAAKLANPDLWEPIIAETGWRWIGQYDGASLVLVRSLDRWLFGREIDGVWCDLTFGLEELPNFKPMQFVPLNKARVEAIFYRCHPARP